MSIHYLIGCMAVFLVAVGVANIVGCLRQASPEPTITKLERPARRQPVTLRGHASRINSVAFSPDGKTLASASSDKTVKLWDLDNGQEKAVLNGNTNFVNKVIFWPDGSLLATASAGADLGTTPDPAITIWDVPTCTKKATIKDHTYAIHCLALSPDGLMLASGDGAALLKGHVKLWDASTFKLRTAIRHLNMVTSVAFSPDGKMLASAAQDLAGHEVALWDLKTRERLATHSHEKFCGPVAFSPDGKWLASGAYDPPGVNGPLGQVLQTVGKVILWDVETGKERYVLKGNTVDVRGVMFSPNGKLLASLCNYELKLWDVASGKELANIKQFIGPTCVAFSPDGATLAFGCLDNEDKPHDVVKLWDVAAALEASK